MQFNSLGINGNDDKGDDEYLVSIRLFEIIW